MSGNEGALRVGIVRLDHARDLPLPAYQTAGSAGLDLAAALGSPVVLGPGARAAIPTGLVMSLPDGFEGQVRPRSGLALKDGLTVLNAPGTVDSDYRGEVKVILVNLGLEEQVIAHGQRIAQLVVAPVTRITWSEHEQPERADGIGRGAGGFGSTGA